MRVIFMGTPNFAVNALENLINSRHQVLAVVTQPDRKRDRGVVTPSAVKVAAEAHGLTVLQYEKVSTEGIETIRRYNPDAIITAAFGQMLSREFLEIAKYGVINVHASLLPKYRGSSPIQWAVINGEKESGVTIMKTAYKMDSGDVILQKKIPIGEDETAGELFDRLSILGAGALIEALDSIEDGTATYTAQNDEESSYYPMLKKSDGLIDFNKTARQIKCQILGMTPWPTAYTRLNGKLLKLIKVGVTNGQGKNGEVIFADRHNGFIIAVGGGALEVELVQPENSKVMTARDYLLGHPVIVGTVLGE